MLGLAYPNFFVLGSAQAEFFLLYCHRKAAGTTSADEKSERKENCDAKSTLESGYDEPSH